MRANQDDCQIFDLSNSKDRVAFTEKGKTRDVSVEGEDQKLCEVKII